MLNFNEIVYEALNDSVYDGQRKTSVDDIFIERLSIAFFRQQLNNINLFIKKPTSATLAKSKRYKGHDPKQHYSRQIIFNTKSLGSDFYFNKRSRYYKYLQDKNVVVTLPKTKQYIPEISSVYEFTFSAYIHLKQIDDSHCEIVLDYILVSEREIPNSKLR